MYVPDHRAVAVKALCDLNNEYVGDDQLMRELFHYVKFGKSALPEIEIATELYRDDEYHHLVDALCLISCPSDRVCISIRLPEHVYRVYQHLFFDVSVFPHTFAMHRYVRNLVTKVSEPIMKLYVDAIERGADAILDRYLVGDRPKPDANKIINTVLSDAYVKFLSHRGYTASSDEAKAALPWGHTAASLARNMLTIERDEIRAKEGQRALEMALKVEDHTRTPEQEGVTLEDIKPDI